MNYDFGYIYREATITLKVTFLNEAIRVLDRFCIVLLPPFF